MAGQCGKLKCCLNYELDCYLDARRDFPDTKIPLETIDGTFFHAKTDVLKRVMWYSSAPGMAANMVEIPVERVKEIQAINKTGKKVDTLLSGKYAPIVEEKPIEFNSVLEGNIDRFDNKRKRNKIRPKNENKPQNGKPQGQKPQNMNAERKPNKQQHPNNRQQRNAANKQQRNIPPKNNESKA